LALLKCAKIGFIGHINRIKKEPTKTGRSGRASVSDIGKQVRKTFDL
jgi:hypothetical protein